MAFPLSVTGRMAATAGFIQSIFPYSSVLSLVLCERVDFTTNSFKRILLNLDQNKRYYHQNWCSNCMTKCINWVRFKKHLKYLLIKSTAHHNIYKVHMKPYLETIADETGRATCNILFQLNLYQPNHVSNLTSNSTYSYNSTYITYS